MSFQINCPHCNRVLNVTEKAYGKVLPCPACQQQMTVPLPPEPLPQATATRPQWSDSVREAAPSPAPERSYPVGVPPTQPRGAPGRGFDDPLGFMDAGPAAARNSPNVQAAQGLNFSDVFLGNEKEYAFDLIPGEQRLDELTIQHQHMFFIKSGITRLTLTSQRLLCTETRVFSPVYWLLLVLFPPLIFYYLARISLNRNVSLPLESIDSIDKQHRPNVGLFVAMLIVTGILALLSGVVVGALAPREPTTTAIVEWIVFVLLSPLTLFLLLATRIPTIDVRTCNNRFVVAYRAGDLGVSEPRIDDFFKAVHAQSQAVKAA